MNGTEIIAKSIKEIGIEYVFGIVGVPITPIAFELQRLGVEFYGFRNEQACSYSSSIVGYLSGKPGVCMTVSGPGMVHAMPGLLNAKSNCWPMILISSSVNRKEAGLGGFQETNQVDCANCLVKKSYQVDTLQEFPEILLQAYTMSLSGRPGPVYIEIPTDLIRSPVIDKTINFKLPGDIKVHREVVNIGDCEKVLELLLEADSPLVIGGKGCSYSRAEGELLEFIHSTSIPLLTSPMGKGLIPDDDSLCVNAARSMALSKADTVLILGARLNWMFQYGTSPTFKENVKIILVDIEKNENLSSSKIVHCINADLKDVLTQLNHVIKLKPFAHKDTQKEWLKTLQIEASNKVQALEKQLQLPQANNTDYLSYHQVYGVLRDKLFLTSENRDYIFVNEGANTMDIGRLCIPQFYPRSRLDAGTLGTMGIGVGYALAAAIVNKHNKTEKPVICIQGDSAFGFSGMEVELAVRYQIPIIFIIINNNGVYEGLEKLPNPPNALNIPPTSLSVDIRYEMFLEAFGGNKGYSISNLTQLTEICNDISKKNISLPTILNIKIKPSSIKPKIIH